MPRHLLLRFRSGVDGPKQCVDELEEHLDWRKMYIPPIVTSWTKNLLESGFMYIHGRDECFRPALILTPSKMDNLGIPKAELADAVI